MAGQEDPYPGQSDASVIASSKRWAALTPHDSNNFAFVPKAVQNASATAGTFVAIGDDDVAATFYAAAGQVLAIRPKRINATGLTGGMAFVGLR